VDQPAEHVPAEDAGAGWRAARLARRERRCKIHGAVRALGVVVGHIEVDRPDNVTIAGGTGADSRRSLPGRRRGRRTGAMRAEALDAYLHPFARPDVPDIFSEAASFRE
jgi:hypothetical protein